MFNKKESKRSFFAIILLMVMMVQVGVKMIHTHHIENTLVSCSECEHHQVHHGHLLSWDGESRDCLLCQLLTNPYTESAITQLSTPHVELYFSTFFYIASDAHHDRGTISLRGPPTASII